LTYITYLIEDCPHSTAKDEGKGYPLVRTPNIGFGRLSLNCVHRVSETVYNQRNVRAVPQTSDLIFAREAPAGNIAVIQEGEQVCLGQRTVLIRPFTQYILSDYLAYYILAPSSQQNLVNKSSGTTVPHVNLSDFRRYLIALPPIKEQRNIIDKISMALPWIEKYGVFSNELQNLNIGINDLLKKSILQEAIQGKLVPQITKEGTAQELLEQIRQEKQKLVREGKLKKSVLTDSVIFKGDDNKYWEKKGKTEKDITDKIPFEIPDSWAWSRLSSLVVLLSGRDLEPSQYNSVSNGIPYMTGASNFRNGNLIKNRWTETPIVISILGDLLITCKGTIGEMSFNTIGDIHIARQIMALRGSFVNLEYIQYYLSTNIQELQKQANSMIPGISRDTLLNALVPLPPLIEQVRIVSKIKQLASIMRG
jgi:type I restriction enzyme S subunit